MPAVVADVEPRDRLELALVENVQRNDLNPIELALAFQHLLAGGHTQEEVGRRVGMERSSVANHVRLLDLAASLQADVEHGRLSAGHAKALLQLSNAERRLHLRDLIVREGLSVRDAEARARSLGGSARRSRQARRPEAPDADTRRLVETLSQRLQTRVRIARSGRKGRIEIDFYGPEDLERLVSQILEGG